MVAEGSKILVVDDDPLVRDMLAMILSDGGYAVETAENGLEALTRLRCGAGTEVIISDMNMPEMDGNELIREIRKNDEDIPIIILTGNNEISVAIEAIRNGANEYLLKDENIQDTVILSVEKVIEKYRLKKQNLQLIEDLAGKNIELEKLNCELLELNEKLSELSATDPLTAIFNRRKLFELLALEVEKAKRYGRPLSLLILDLDHFKRVNDTFGHNAGDEVLKTTTNIINGVIKRIDIFARYGGEEFIIVLPETTLAGAAALAEKIRAVIDQHLFPVVGRITVSIGAAEFSGNETDAVRQEGGRSPLCGKKKRQKQSGTRNCPVRRITSWMTGNHPGRCRTGNARASILKLSQIISSILPLCILNCLPSLFASSVL